MLKKFLIIMFLSVVLIGFIGCGEKEEAVPQQEQPPQAEKPEAGGTETPQAEQPAQEPQTEETEQAEQPEQAVEGTAETRGSYTLELGPNETKSVTETFKEFILATGLAKTSIRIKFIDITDAANPKVIRSEVVSSGAEFKIRNNFAGATKTIKVEVTNLKDTAGTVNLTLQ
ncbi:MAG: hypothetical protein GY950_20920 [bacterium]|nr:hypothetical protein [bacterium]